MNHTRSPYKNTGLLVSVRSAEEANIAVESGCVSIIDLKEPTNGSLGCVSIDIAGKILSHLPDSICKSIALGEVVDWPIWPTADLATRDEVLSQFHFAKAGLSGLANDIDWVQRWKACLSELPENVQRVAVAYADADRAGSPSVPSILRSAPEVGCSVLLIDTFCKDRGGLLDLYSIEALTQIVQAARANGLKVVLAGSLDLASTETVRTAEPDFVAVRGAVCGQGRTSKIELNKVTKLGRLIRECDRS